MYHIDLEEWGFLYPAKDMDRLQNSDAKAENYFTFGDDSIFGT
jgi:hypothetical protein